MPSQVHVKQGLRYHTSDIVRPHTPLCVSPQTSLRNKFSALFDLIVI